MVRSSITARAALASVALALGAAQLASAGPPRFDGPTIKNPAVPPGFVLRDQDGKVISLTQERGNVVLLTFLYTHCPNVCPLTARNLNQALRLLGPSRRHVRVLAISVDPHGDTPHAVREFIRAHRLLPQFRYLTGSASSLETVWAAYFVTSLAVAGGKRVDHTLFTFLLDSTLKARVIYDATATPAAIAHDTRILLPPAR